MINIELTGEVEFKLREIRKHYNQYSPDEWTFEDMVILAIENMYSELDLELRNQSEVSA